MRVNEYHHDESAGRRLAQLKAKSHPSSSCYSTHLHGEDAGNRTEQDAGGRGQDEELHCWLKVGYELCVFMIKTVFSSTIPVSTDGTGIPYLTFLFCTVVHFFSEQNSIN
jgi:hypothetical protein